MKLTLTALLFAALAPSSFFGAGFCGVPPVAPVPPIGCKRLQPVCQCDSRGQNCHYVFVCVK